MNCSPCFFFIPEFILEPPLVCQSASGTLRAVTHHKSGACARGGGRGDTGACGGRNDSHKFRSIRTKIYVPKLTINKFRVITRNLRHRQSRQDSIDSQRFNRIPIPFARASLLPPSPGKRHADITPFATSVVPSAPQRPHRPQPPWHRRSGSPHLLFPFSAKPFRRLSTTARWTHRVCMEAKAPTQWPSVVSSHWDLALQNCFPSPSWNAQRISKAIHTRLPNDAISRSCPWFLSL